jgi:hypothetical protein
MLATTGPKSNLNSANARNSQKMGQMKAEKNKKRWEVLASELYHI